LGHTGSIEHEILDETGQERTVYATFAIVVFAGVVLGTRPTVGDVRPNSETSRRQRADLPSERMVSAVACAVDEHDRTLAALGGQCVEHAHEGRHADAGTDEHDRTCAAGQHEVAGRPTRIDERSRLDVIVQVA